MAVLTASGGAVGCDGQGATDARTSSPTPAASTATPAGTDPIRIEETIADARVHTGVVLASSVIAEAAFCRGGHSRGGSSGETITETFECAEGTLEVRFKLVQRSLVQGGIWEIVSGTGSYAGLRGGGSMVVTFETANPDVGRAVFTGLVGK